MKSSSAPHLRWIVIIGVLLLAACSDDPDVETNQPLDNQNTTNGDDASDYCQADAWTCADYDDGFALSLRRHGHAAFYLGDDQVLLYGGSERLESLASSRSETWEVVNVSTEEIVATGDLAIQSGDTQGRFRAGPSLVQLDNQGLLAIGGSTRIGGNDLALESVDYFHPQSLSWGAAPAMDQSYDRAVRLSDGTVLAMSAERSGGATLVTGQRFDPDQWSWSGITGVELPHEPVWDLSFEPTTDGRVVLAYRYLAPEELQPDEEDIDLYTAAAAIFDPTSGDLASLREFDETFGVTLLVNVTALPMTGQSLIHLRPFDLEGELDTHAFIVDPAAGAIDDLYVREPPPGEPMTVLPGDEVLYRSSTQMQRFDVPGDRWRNFGALPDKIYYSSLVMLPDCTLFLSGERTLNAPNDELRGVDSAFCYPD